MHIFNYKIFDSEQLLFDEENSLHSTDKWLFSTEGHLLQIKRPPSVTEECQKLSRKNQCLRDSISQSLPQSSLNSSNYREAPGSCPGQCFRFSRRFDSLPLPAQYIRQTESAIGLRTI